MLHLSVEHSDSRVLNCSSCDERFGDLNRLRNHDCNVEEGLQRCASAKEDKTEQEKDEKLEG